MMPAHASEEVSSTSQPVAVQAIERLQRPIEALLFVAAEPLSIKDIAKLTRCSHVEVAAALQKIAADFSDRGIVLREVAGGYRFASSPRAREVVELYLLPPKTSLSTPALESLAIVAYLQPVTKSEIEAIRGVSADSVVTTLLDRGLIAEMGRKEVVGRPLLYKTTPEFLQSFGLRSLEDLPEMQLPSGEALAPQTLTQAISSSRAPQVQAAQAAAS